MKFWAQRGTLHLVTSADHSTWVTGLDLYRRSYAHYGMRDSDLLDLAGLIGEALKHQVLSRAYLAQRLHNTGKVTGGLAARLEGSLGSELKPASFLGHLCYGPGENGRAHLPNPSTWLRSLVPHTTQGWVSPVITVNGRIVGTWSSQTLQVAEVSEPLAAPAAAALRDEIERAHEDRTSRAPKRSTGP